MPESIREKYKEETGLEPLTKTGIKTKAYTEYLLDPTKCTVPWMANWNLLYKKNKEKPYKDRDTIMKDLTETDKKKRLEEKCIRGGVGRGELLKAVSEFRREAKEKFEIPNY